MVAAAVLAGGASSRMGVDKARLPWHGAPLAERMARLLENSGLGPCVLVRRGAPDGLPWSHPVIRDAPDCPAHPLSGALTALHWSHGSVVVVATDLIHLGSGDLERLARKASSVLWWQGRHALAMRLEPEDIGPLEAVVSSGAPVRGWVEQRPRVEAGRDPGNLNRPEDFAPFDPSLALVTALGVSGDEAERVRRGERQRLRLRGCLLPPW